MTKNNNPSKTPEYHSIYRDLFISGMEKETLLLRILETESLFLDNIFQMLDLLFETCGDTIAQSINYCLTANEELTEEERLSLVNAMKCWEYFVKTREDYSRETREDYKRRASMYRERAEEKEEIREIFK